MTTCYDVRFPALYTELADRGAKVMTVSASWGSGPGKLDQWTLLVRARALDTTSFVAAAGQAYPVPELAGKGAPMGVGGSLIASPLGEVVADAGADPAIVVADIDLHAVDDARNTIAVLSNRSSFAQPDKAESRG